MNYGEYGDLNNQSVLVEGSIVKTFFGKYIDMSKVVSIDEAKFIDKRGHGGYYVGFSIQCQLLESPIEYMCTLPYGEQKIAEEGTRGFGYKGHDLNSLKLLKYRIHELVELWIEVNKKRGK